jgi:catechol 2,3-dioxygenase-like lactoylglutathione lyase family enzyme
VVCDALILDEESRSDTYPYIKIDADDVDIGHEATVSKIGEEQLFYLMSRGLTEAGGERDDRERLRRADHEGAAARVRRRDEPPDPAPDGGLGRLSSIAKVDAVGIPSTDWERSRRFYVETLGLRPDEHAKGEFWVGDTCFAIWMPEQWGEEFKPQTNAIVLLHVDDVEAARAELEAKGVEFDGETVDTSVCHMATFLDPDGNPLVLHKRYAPYA